MSEPTPVNRALSQFMTPSSLAEQIAQWAGDGIAPRSSLQGVSVLEPSAGDGSLVRALLSRGAEVYAVEIDPQLARAYLEPCFEAVHVSVCDFLELVPSRRFDHRGDESAIRGRPSRAPHSPRSPVLRSRGRACPAHDARKQSPSRWHVVSLPA